MFQLKNFVSIAASMLNYVRSTTGKVTDLQPGSVTRTLIEAPAAEIEELYVQVFNGIREAIPVAVYNSINFPKLAPHYASGRVTVSAITPLTQPLVVPKGTQFLARDGRVYVTVGDLTWTPKDSSGTDQKHFTFPVVSLNPGVTQNAAAQEINASPFFPQDQFTFNSTDMINGSDEETDAARDIRFADYIQSLSRGTEAALLYGARSAKILDAAGNIIESVARASLTVSTGSVQVNIWGTNGAPSPALINRVQEIELGYRDANGVTVPGYAAAGIRCQIASMASRAVKVNFEIEMLDGYTLTAAVQQGVKDALESFLYNVSAGQVVYIDNIRAVALLVRGVKSATVDLQQNITCGVNEVLVPGTVNVDAKPVTRIVSITYSVELPNSGAITQQMLQDMSEAFKVAIENVQPGDTISVTTLEAIAYVTIGAISATINLPNGITRGINETLLPGTVNVVAN
ncbi:baseplate J/gp47 family protein [Salmonella enterica]|nr:baseplate J/gp47 family protein [Salmonella enterica]